MRGESMFPGFATGVRWIARICNSLILLAILFLPFCALSTAYSRQYLGFEPGMTKDQVRELLRERHRVKDVFLPRFQSEDLAVHIESPSAVIGLSFYENKLYEIFISFLDNSFDPRVQLREQYGAPNESRYGTEVWLFDDGRYRVRADEGIVLILDLEARDRVIQHELDAIFWTIPD